MKKYFLLSICLIPLLGYAQPVMTSASHGLMPETVNRMQPVEYVSAGNAGAQVVWDFKHLLPVEDDAMIKESITQLEGNNMLITNLKGGKFSHTCDRTSRFYNSYQDEHYAIIFDQPIKKMSYPFMYGDKISGYFSGRILYNNSNLEFKRAGSYSTEADATGTLVMPGGQVLKNVLRVKMTEKYIEQACSNIEVEYVKYVWYIEEYRYPVFAVHDITYTYPDGKVTTKRNACVTIASLEQAADIPVYESDTPSVTKKNTQIEIEHSVYPNPYSDLLHITYTLDKPTTVNISLYSLSGNLISNIVQGKVQDGVQHITYTPKYNENTGAYYLRLQFGDKVYVRALVKN